MDYNYQPDVYEADVFCRLLWLYLADEGVPEKGMSSFWKKHNFDPNKICAECFACHFTAFECEKYLYVWDKKRTCLCHCQNYDSYYKKWNSAPTKEERKKWALKIANQPVAREYIKACKGG